MTNSEDLMKREIEEKLWQQIREAGKWLEGISRKNSLELLDWCVDYLTGINERVSKLKKIIFPPASATAADKKETKPRRKAIQKKETIKPLKESSLEILEVLLGLKEKERPISKSEAARLIWSEESVNPSAIPRLIQRIYRTLEKDLPSVKSAIKDKDRIPPENKEFYDKLFQKYPELTPEKLENLLASYQKKQNKEKQGRIRQARRTRRRKEKILNGKRLDLKIEWLKPLRALFFHPEGATMNKEILMKRTDISSEYIEPIIKGGLKSLQWVLAGKMESPEPEFIKALKEKWPGKELKEIISLITTGNNEEIKVDFL